MIEFIGEIAYGIWQNMLLVISWTWWILLPAWLLIIWWYFWKFYIQLFYLQSQRWVLLEIKIPSDIEKTPKGMEQIFASFYAIYSFGLKVSEMYWQGRLEEDYVSLEMVGNAGSVHFFIRTPVNFRNLIESAIYAQYPQAEIFEAEDYTKQFPNVLPNKTYDLWGTDYYFNNKNIFPIRTYEFFEGQVEEKRVDPLGNLIEVMSRLQKDEALWVQILMMPADSAWKDEAAALRDKMLKRQAAPKAPSLAGKAFEFGQHLATAPFGKSEWEKPKVPDKKEAGSLMHLSEGEKDMLKAVELKASKLGFTCNLRFIYIDRRDSFTGLNVAATMSTFMQFNDLASNGFRPNKQTMTKAKGIFKKSEMFYRKRMLYQNYLRLNFSPKTMILNTEELATLFHFPNFLVQAPAVERVEAKKAGPPTDLPIDR